MTSGARTRAPQPKPNFIVVRAESSGLPRPCRRRDGPFLYCSCVQCGDNVRVPVGVMTEGFMTARLSRMTIIITCFACFERIPTEDVVDRYLMMADDD